MSERTWPRDIDGNFVHDNGCAMQADPADGFVYCTCGLLAEMLEGPTE